MSTTDWTVDGAEGQPIFGSTHLPPSSTRRCGVLLLCHGFRGYKDYGFLPALAQRASEQGLIAHRFNFSHSGVTQAFQTFERRDLFERDTWGKQIHDLQVVAAACREILPGATGQRLPTVWFGHSRGGVTVLLTASRPRHGDSSANPPAGVVVAAAPCRSCHLDDHQKRKMHQEGYLEMPSSRTGQVLRMGKEWLEEIEQQPEAFDPLAAIAVLGCPVLLIHGDQDETVPVDDATGLYQRAVPGQARLEVIPGASHTFNAPNPLPLQQPPPPATGQMMDLVIEFAVNQCSAGQ